MCRRLQLQPMAVKGDVAELRPVINDLGLADISQSKTSDSDINTSTDDAANQAEARQTGAKQAEVGKNTGNHNKTSSASQVNYSAPEVEATPVVPVLKPAKVIMRPVRSGQQVYAEGSDLVVTASVSEGAELLADGNIHVYGTLRGRALAGVKGNNNARVFCQSLDAELVSIAGQFIMHDTVKGECWKKPAQIYLEEDTLRIEALV